jgi:hypothetical protein
MIYISHISISVVSFLELMRLISELIIIIIIIILQPFVGPWPLFSVS